MPTRRIAPGTAAGAVVATALLFVANGAVFGGVVPRLPDLKDTLGLGTAAFGLAMSAYPAGALVGGLAAPALMRRRSDGAVAVMTMTLASAVASLLWLAPTVGAFAALLTAFGMADALTDVSMNAHGIRVQVRVGRSLVNRFHALWSLGAVLGAGIGSLAAGFGVGVGPQFVATGLVCFAGACAAWPLRLSGTIATADPSAPPRRSLSNIPVAVWLRLVALGLLACCAELVEDFAQTWSALYLREVAAAGAGLAGAGFIAIQGAQLLGRLLGDRLVDTRGAAAVGREGGICVALGAGGALAASFLLDGPVMVVVVLGGLALAGWGIATVIPGAMVACDSAPGLPAGVGLTALNWVMRLGFLLSPPLVGALGEAAGLRWTVAPMILAGLLIAAGSEPLPGRPVR